MRVLLTTDTIGGVWTFTKELASGLLAQGHAVALVSFGRAPSREQSAWCARFVGQHQGQFEYHASSVALEWMSENHNAYEDGHHLLMQVATSFGPDVIHSNQFCFGCLPTAVPVIVTAHSDVVSWAAACRPEGLPPSTWFSHYRALVSEGLRAAHSIVAPTRWMMSTLGKHYGGASGQVIPNGRGIPYSTSQTRKLQAVAVGRFWDEAKNLAVLAKVRSAIPILVAGELHFNCVREEMDLGNVSSLGHLGEDSLHTLFQESSIYLATSIYEPFGLAPLEAALCGCALVANDIPSLREVWGQGALYFRNADELTQILEQLAASPELLSTRQRRSKRRALRFSGSRMTNKYLGLYHSLVAQGAEPEFAAHVA